MRQRSVAPLQRPPVPPESCRQSGGDEEGVQRRRQHPRGPHFQVAHGGSRFKWGRPNPTRAARVPSRPATVPVCRIEACKVGKEGAAARPRRLGRLGRAGGAPSRSPASSEIGPTPPGRACADLSHESYQRPGSAGAPRSQPCRQVWGLRVRAQRAWARADGACCSGCTQAFQCSEHCKARSERSQPSMPVAKPESRKPLRAAAGQPGCRSAPIRSAPPACGGLRILPTQCCTALPNTPTLATSSSTPRVNEEP